MSQWPRVLRRPAAPLAVLALLASGATVARAMDPERAVSQYVRERWGADRGLPGGTIRAISQSADGYLWIGTDKGLVRFDGATFRTFPEGSEKGGSIAPVLGLTADARGTLWARLGGAKVVRYRDGRLESLLALETTEDAVTAMARGKDGGILLSGIVNGVLAWRRGRLEAVSPAAKLPARSPVISMSEAADGRLWLGTQDEGLFSLDDARVTPVKEGLPDRKVNVLLAVSSRDVWVGTDHGLVRWNGKALSAEGVAPVLRQATVSAMIADRESNVWIGTPQGVWRANARGASLLEDRDESAAASVTALFEDREGSLWVGSSRGLERLRDSSFTTFGRAEGLPSESSGPIYADAAGRTWFAPSSGGLYWLRNGTARRVADAGLADDVVYSIAASRDGLWVGRRAGGLSHLSVRGEAITAKTYRRGDGLAEDSVYAVHEGRDGAVWAGTLGSGVSRFQDGRFTTFDVASGLPSNTVTSIVDTADGAVWVATPSGLAALANGRWTVYTLRQGLPSDDVNCLFEDSGGVLWIGTGDGLASIASGRVRVPEGLAATLHEQVFGIAEDRQGWLWIATSRRVLRVRRDELLENRLRGAGVAEYGVSDGLVTTEAAKRHRSVVSDPFGRIWFSMSRGLSVIDPVRATSSAAPLMARLEGISADGIAVALEGPRRLAPGSRRVTFGYSGVNLSAPERIRFRYRLDGFDSGWSEPVSAREAVYTNLGPGPYQFRVMASNSEGVWNGEEAATAIEIAPFLWQTRWFRSAVLLTAAVVLLVLYRMRLHRLTRQITVRFEERLAERTRIAQDLHDTLLQGFLSASMQLHVAVDQIAPDRPEKARLAGVLSLMARVIDEGRHAVRGLRSSEGHYDDLEQSFARIREELGLAEEAVEFRVTGEGKIRPLHPLIRDDVYRIGREALINAFRHSGARRIDAVVERDRHRLRIAVRDDGRGIEEDVLRAGRDGHWGLPGMRERAERIGGRLQVSSRPSGGTEIELSVPGHVAFRSPEPETQRGGLARLRAWARARLRRTPDPPSGTG